MTSSLVSTDAPLVTLGVPVYNGERYLAHALQSLSTQDYANLEILISDNESADGTEEICREFASKDDRIRYFRQPENLGALRNFEFLVAQARGNYFAWCAHDDVRRPNFVKACVEALQNHPSAVLCNGAVQFLDEQGAIRSEWVDLNFETLGIEKSERMLRLVNHTHWVEMYGLMRMDALRRALPIESVWGFDVVLSMRLLGMGDFIKIPDILFQYRVRSEAKDPEETMLEVTGNRTSLQHPFLDMLESLLRVGLEALPKEHERTFFMEYLRTIIGAGRHGPCASWLEILAPECTPNGRLELVPFHLASHLVPTLTGESSIDSFLDSEVEAILLGCPPDGDTLRSIPEIAKALKLKYPHARLILVGASSALARVCPLGEEKRFQLPSQWRREAIYSLIRELVKERIDLAIHPGITRKEVALDICLTGCGAFRTIGFMSRLIDVRRALVSKILKRYRAGNMNTAFTHLLSPCPARSRAQEILKTLGPSLAGQIR